MTLPISQIDAGVVFQTPFVELFDVAVLLKDAGLVGSPTVATVGLVSKRAAIAKLAVGKWAVVAEVGLVDVVTTVVLVEEVEGYVVEPEVAVVLGFGASRWLETRALWTKKR